MPRTPRLSEIKVSYYKPKTGNIDATLHSNIGVTEAHVSADIQNQRFISPQKGRIAKRPVKNDVLPTPSFQRSVRQVHWGEPLPHPDPVVSGITNLSRTIQKQNLILERKFKPLTQKDMSIATDEQVSSNVLPEGTKLDRDQLERRLLSVGKDKKGNKISRETVESLSDNELVTGVFNSFKDVNVSDDFGRLIETKSKAEFDATFDEADAILDAIARDVPLSSPLTPASRSKGLSEPRSGTSTRNPRLITNIGSSIGGFF